MTDIRMALITINIIAVMVGRDSLKGLSLFAKNYLVTPEKHFNGSPSRISLVCLLQVLFVRLSFLMTGMEISNFGKQ